MSWHITATTESGERVTLDYASEYDVIVEMANVVSGCGYHRAHPPTYWDGYEQVPWTDHVNLAGFVVIDHLPMRVLSARIHERVDFD